MSPLPVNLFANPVWHALQTQHRHLAIAAGDACRYRADVAPFASVSEPTEAALQQLCSLLAPGEFVWLIGESYPHIAELNWEGTLPCLQMILPDAIEPPEMGAGIDALSCANGREMVALTDVAFPGFFRPRTCEMGSYFGVRSSGELIAMAGERLKLDGYTELSGICTHPEYRGKGLAANVIWRLVRHQRAQGVASWLHVTSTNQHAIDLYLRLGFQAVRTVTLHRVSRNSTS
jgi:GNAT superfamily N-acetyltransferase